MTARGEPTQNAGLGARDRPLSVGDVVRAARIAVHELGPCWVEGEVSSLTRPSSGHVYFVLKDSRACIPVVLFRTDAQRLKFRLEQGQRVLCGGRLDVFDRDGKFQLYARVIEPAGLGAEALALQQLKQKLAAEGLFAADRKRPLPLLPRRIGVVTSRSGAAVRDIIRAVQRRFPVPILIADAQVQGATAPQQLVGALRAIVRMRVDLVIIGRGGGSAVDLAAFNDERLVRAVAACPVPVISAVGHEIDVTLCDLAADRRAATPTMAGEMAVPVLAELAQQLRKEERRLQREIELVLRGGRQEIDQALGAGAGRLAVVLAERRRRLADLERRLEARHPRAEMAARRAALTGLGVRLDAARGRVAEAHRRNLAALVARFEAHHPGVGLVRRRGSLRQLEARLEAATRRRFDGAGRALGGLAGRLEAMSPLRVLDRGYALATARGHVLTDAAVVAAGDPVRVRLARGAIDCRVEAVHAGDPAAAAAVLADAGIDVTDGGEP